MTRSEELKALFEKLTWINLSVFAEKIDMNRQNLVKYVTGKREMTEATYQKIMDGLAEIKKELP